MSDVLIFVLVLVLAVGLGLGLPLLLMRGFRREVKGLSSAFSARQPWKEDEEQIDELHDLVTRIKEQNQEENGN